MKKFLIEGKEFYYNERKKVVLNDKKKLFAGFYESFEEAKKSIFKILKTSENH